MTLLGAFACLSGLLASALQIGIEYDRDVGRLHGRLDQIEAGYLDSIRETVWLQDTERLGLLVMGIHSLPDLALVEVRDQGGAVLATAGIPEPGPTLVRRSPLEYRYDGRMIAIGTMTVTARLSGLHTRAVERAWLVVGITVVLVLAASAFLYLAVHHLVTGRLQRLARLARTLGHQGLSEPLPEATAALGRSDAADEFSDLAHAFDDMGRRLRQSFVALQDSEARYRDLFTGSPVALWEEDFSAVKEALDGLRPTVSDLDAHLDAAPETVARLAAQVRILDVNEATLALHRANSKQDLLTGLPSTFTARSLASFRRELLAIWHGETELTLESEVMTLDGDPRQVVVRWSVPPDCHDTLARVFVALDDITERKAAETTLAITVEKLMQANSELERFTWVAAHDLQEPVRNVVSFAQLLERHLGPTLDAEAKEFLAYLQAAAMRMHQQTAGLLTYSRAGGSARPFEPVDMNRALASAMAALAAPIAEANATVEAGPLPTVSGDPVLLADLLRDLLSNAVKFRRPDAAPVIRIGAEPSPSGWAFSIADNGIGFDARFAGEIFVVFRRLHGPDRYPGAGIGLATCRRIVERHGGRIRAESTPGTGTTITFTLPADTMTHPTPASA
ncbi:MAG: two-component sensor histidine kinase [Magnetospirillum sp.]|nr:two-component sensor histidine kinase [Magnetospirillum sp.]